MKPIAFISHSSRDGPAMERLKQLLISKTHGTIDFFLSCDGESIGAGQNWAIKTLSALSDASVVFAFISPNSLQSQWMFFEAGIAYNRGIPVVPIGIFGVEFTSLPTPLALLQGFNLDASAGLNRIIRSVNQVFSHSHSLDFTHSDFEQFETNRAVVALADGEYECQVLSRGPDGEKLFHRAHIRIDSPRMTVKSLGRKSNWESVGILDRNRFVGRFKYDRGSTPRDLGMHDFIWDGNEFLGSAKIDSGGWFAENLVWRPL